MAIIIKWGKERISFQLPPPDTPLSAVKDAVAEYTHLPKDSFKLIHAGAIMRDDNAPISAYRLHDNSVIQLVGSTAQDNAPLRNIPVQKTETSVITQIQSELSAVRTTLSPSVEAFLSTLQPQDPSTPTSKPSPAADKEHTRLGELLLQSLLRLDAISPDGSWEDARKERKIAVKEVQSLLDRLDDTWAAVRQDTHT